MNARVALRFALLCTALVIMPCAAFAQPKKSPEITEAAPPVHGFSVALVLGDMQGASTPDDRVPVGARKALTDMRDFLPYKSYRLLDLQFIRCCASKGAGLLSGRLRGLDEQPYSFVVDYGLSSKLAIRFSLREEPSTKKLGSSNTPDAAFLVAQLEEKRKQYTAGHPAIKELERQLREVEEQSRMTAPSKSVVVDSTFSMDVGETVVIGSSSLKGDKALIALLTAVRRPDSPSATQGEKK